MSSTGIIIVLLSVFFAVQFSFFASVTPPVATGLLSRAALIGSRTDERIRLGCFWVVLPSVSMEHYNPLSNSVGTAAVVSELARAMERDFQLATASNTGRRPVNLERRGDSRHGLQTIQDPFGRTTIKGTRMQRGTARGAGCTPRPTQEGSTGRRYHLVIRRGTLRGQEGAQLRVSNIYGSEYSSRTVLGQDSASPRIHARGGALTLRRVLGYGNRGQAMSYESPSGIYFNPQHWHAIVRRTGQSSYFEVDMHQQKC